MNLTILTIAILGFFFIIIGTLYELKSDIKRLNKKIDAIAKQLDLPDTLTSELKDLLSDGEKIKAIKKYRAATGAGLKESKEYIDSLEN